MTKRNAKKPRQTTGRERQNKNDIISVVPEQRNSYDIHKGMKSYETRKFVAYYRVSTKRQGKSGLGLEAQKEAVETFARERGYDIISEFTEVESGTNPKRPQLDAAMLYARKYRAGLVVGKLDRLGRVAWRLLKLLNESKVPIRFADFPDADETFLGFMIIIADREAKLISERTRQALQAAKKRGTKLGTDRPGHWTPSAIKKRDKALTKATAEAAQKNRAEANDFYEVVGPDIVALRNQGLSYDAIATRLNDDGIPSRRGGKWYAGQVRHVFMNFRKEPGK